MPQRPVRMETNLPETLEQLHPDLKRENDFGPQIAVGILGLLVVAVLILLALAALSGWQASKLVFYLQLGGVMVVSAGAVVFAGSVMDTQSRKWSHLLTDVYSQSTPTICTIEILPLPQNSTDALFHAKNASIQSVKVRIQTGVQIDETTFFAPISVFESIEFHTQLQARAYTDPDSGRVLCLETNKIRLWRTPYSIQTKHVPPPEPPPVSAPPLKRLTGLSRSVVEHVLKQAAFGVAWRECCAELMAANNITEAQIQQEISRRADSLVWKPYGDQFLLSCLSGFAVNTMTHLSWDATVWLVFVSWLAAQPVYDTLLLVLQRLRIYIESHNSRLFGTATCFALSTAMLLALIPQSSTMAALAHAMGLFSWFLSLPPLAYAAYTRKLLSRDRNAK